MTSFGFGRELVDRAEGAYIYLHDGRRILDFTGGVGRAQPRPQPSAHPGRAAALRRSSSGWRYTKPTSRPIWRHWDTTSPSCCPATSTCRSCPTPAPRRSRARSSWPTNTTAASATRSCAPTSASTASCSAPAASPALRTTSRSPTIPGIDVFAYGDLDSVRAALAPRTPATSTPSSSSRSAPRPMRWCSEEFLRGLRELCTANDIVLIFDEIYTGWGKTGSLFYFMRYEGLMPDVLTTSKSFGGGKSPPSRPSSPGEPVFRQAYDNAMMRCCSRHQHDLLRLRRGVRHRDRGDQHRGRGRLPGPRPAIWKRPGTGVAAPGQGSTPTRSLRVAGAGALWGVFIEGGPQAPRPRRQARARRAGPRPALQDQAGHLRRRSTRSTTTTTSTPTTRSTGDNPLVAAAQPGRRAGDVERFLDALDAVLDRGLTSC